MKVIKNLVTVLSGIAALIAVTALVLVLLGYRPFVLMSGSMAPLYPEGSLCFVNTSLLGGINRLLDLGEGLLVSLGDDAGNGVLLLAAVDALGLPDVRKTDAARDNHFGRGQGFVNF